VVRNPIYSTGVGLLLFGQRNRAQSGHELANEGSLKAIWERMKHWFQGNF
jgi:cell division protein FtsA